MEQRKVNGENMDKASGHVSLWLGVLLLTTTKNLHQPGARFLSRSGMVG